jgi:hypothetical protein
MTGDVRHEGPHLHGHLDLRFIIRLPIQQRRGLGLGGGLRCSTEKGAKGVR